MHSRLSMGKYWQVLREDYKGFWNTATGWGAGQFLSGERGGGGAKDCVQQTLCSDQNVLRSVAPATGGSRTLGM